MLSMELSSWNICVFFKSSIPSLMYLWNCQVFKKVNDYVIRLICAETNKCFVYNFEKESLFIILWIYEIKQIYEKLFDKSSWRYMKICLGNRYLNCIRLLLICWWYIQMKCLMAINSFYRPHQEEFLFWLFIQVMQITMRNSISTNTTNLLKCRNQLTPCQL